MAALYNHSFNLRSMEELHLLMNTLPLRYINTLHVRNWDDSKRPPYHVQMGTTAVIDESVMCRRLKELDDEIDLLEFYDCAILNRVRRTKSFNANLNESNG
jgi:hypothetical protein